MPRPQPDRRNAEEKKPEKSRRSRGLDTFLGLFIPLTLIGIAIADFVRSGHVDKYLIGALLIFGLGALGWRVDVILEKWLDRNN